MTKSHKASLASASIWKPIAVILGSLLLLVVVALGTMYYVAGTPGYSLYRLRAAVRDQDFVTFDHHFDTKKVISNAIQREVGWLPAGPRIVSQKATEMLIPASERIIRERIHEKLTEKDSSPMLKMTYESVSYVNNAAIVVLRDPADGSETKLTLERMPDRMWKVIDLDLSKAGISYSLQEAREDAEKLLDPVMPTPVKPGPLVPGITDIPPTAP